MTMLCVLAHSLGACCVFAHAGCSHGSSQVTIEQEPLNDCSKDCCRHDTPQEENSRDQQPCQNHNHDNCEHCSGNCFQVIVTVISLLDLVDDLPVMVVFDVAALDQIANADDFATSEDHHTFVRFAAPIFSQNQSLLI